MKNVLVENWLILETEHAAEEGFAGVGVCPLLPACVYCSDFVNEPCRDFNFFFLWDTQNLSWYTSPDVNLWFLGVKFIPCLTLMGYKTCAMISQL